MSSESTRLGLRSPTTWGELYPVNGGWRQIVKATWSVSQMLTRFSNSIPTCWLLQFPHYVAVSVPNPMPGYEYGKQWFASAECFPSSRRHYTVEIGNQHGRIFITKSTKFLETFLFFYCHLQSSNILVSYSVKLY